MRFHDFESAKSRIIADCQQKLKAAGRPESLSVLTGSVMYTTSIQNARKRSSKEVLEHVIKQPPLDIKGGKYEAKCQGDSEREHISALSEYEWLESDRPFYNVYPIVEKLVRNTKLQVSAAFLNLPYRTMLFRFPAGHEPYGIKTILLTVGHPHNVPKNTEYFNSAGEDIMRGVAATATVQYVHTLSDESKHDVFTLAALFSRVAHNAFRPYEPRFPLNFGDQTGYTERAMQYQALQAPDPLSPDEQFGFSRNFERIPGNTNDSAEGAQCILRSLEETILAQRDIEIYPGNRKSHPTYMGFQSQEVHEFVFKLAMLTSMLHRGDNLIAPIVLAKHQERYDKETDAAAKKWLEDKAAQIQGRGFSVGKELQKKTEISPHIRNPHMALYWTGPGRKEPVLIFRAGAKVLLKKLESVPTGFLGPEKPDETAENTREEYVYFLREPYTGFVKIGRTSRTVAERKRQLECGIHGLILVGHIVTGDCVALETRLHREHAAKRRRRDDGRQSEFFELTDAEVQNIVAQHGGTFHLDMETE